MIVGLGGVVIIAWPRLTLLTSRVGGDAVIGLLAAPPAAWCWARSRNCWCGA